MSTKKLRLSVAGNALYQSSDEGSGGIIFRGRIPPSWVIEVDHDHHDGLWTVFIESESGPIASGPCGQGTSFSEALQNWYDQTEIPAESAADYLSLRESVSSSAASHRARGN